MKRPLLWFFLLGTAFGIVLTKSEVISWFRIQEMFRFQSFHMYGVLGSGVLVAAVTSRLMGRRPVSALCGDLDDERLGPVPDRKSVV